MSRAQSNVVGVALLVGVTVLSLGLLTASVGTVVEQGAARADADRVAEEFADALRPTERTGAQATEVAFVEGELRTVERDLRVLADGEVVAHRSVGALRFDGPGGGATFLAGAVLRTGAAPVLRRPPPIRRSGSLLVVNAPVLSGSVSYGASGGAEPTLRTTVRHERTRLPAREYAVALESATPDPLAAAFRERGLPVAVRDLDGDGVPSVVVSFPGARPALLVTHETEVRLDA